MKNRQYIFALLLCLTACGGEKITETAVHNEHDEVTAIQLTQAQFDAAEVQLVQLERKQVNGQVKANGMMAVTPQDQVTISAPMAGFVQQLKVLVGSYVTKGQVVAVLQNQEYVQLQQEYLENYGTLELVQAEYERQKELAKEQINARKALEQAKANFTVLQGKLAGLKARLELLKIPIVEVQKGKIQQHIQLYAPISGYITKVNTNTGAYVSPTDVMMELVNTQALFASLTVYEKDITSIKEGQTVRVQLVNNPEMVEATVKLIGKELDVNRSVQVHCVLKHANKNMLPGMYVTGSIETTNLQILAVPEEALLYYEGKTYVFLEDKPLNYTFTEVTIGKTEGGFVAVELPKTADLKKRVVVQGAFRLLAKLKNTGGDED